MAAPTNYADANIIDLASTNTTPIRIEDIYENKYASKRNDALAAHQFEWTMFAMLVKGKDVNAAVKSASKRNPLVHVHGGFIVNAKDPSPSDLTRKRLSACLLYDNCSNLDGKMRLCLLTTLGANRPRNAGLLMHLSHVGVLELDNAPAACGLDPAHSTDTLSKSSRARCMIITVHEIVGATPEDDFDLFALVGAEITVVTPVTDAEIVEPVCGQGKDEEPLGDVTAVMPSEGEDIDAIDDLVLERPEQQSNRKSRCPPPRALDAGHLLMKAYNPQEEDEGQSGVRNFDSMEDTRKDTTAKAPRDAYNRGLSLGLKSPPKKRGRIIVLHAGSEGGFVQGAAKVFREKKGTDDSHQEMDGKRFKKWFTEKFLPNIKVHSVIVMDNASYSSVKLYASPSSSRLKKDVQGWPTLHGVTSESTMLKVELLNLVKMERVKRPELEECHVDAIAEQHGHVVLSLPPYHCELNPIELEWSQAKGYIASHNVTFKIVDVEALTPVTP
ncbi:uncharacterized protein ISCGN_031690 [Ixodes scapularis]